MLAEDTSRDRTILYAGAFVRAVATGLAGVLAGTYLARLNMPPFAAGLVVGSGLAGGTVATLAVTLTADRIGRRRTLIALSLLAFSGGMAFASSSELAVLLPVAFVGMLNGMGRDRGPSAVLDNAMLPGTTFVEDRTRTFARYNVFQDIGHAVGSLAGGLPAFLIGAGYGELSSVRWSLVLYASLMLTAAVLYSGLSPKVESSSQKRQRLSPESRRVTWKISSLFGLDAVGGGFLTTALLSYFFFERFGVEESLIATLFFVARLANMASYPIAAGLAHRFGLLNTMVFTHIPSSIFLMTVAFAPSFAVAAVLFLARELLVEMDAPTRQSYVVAIVKPNERVTVSGATHLVRMGGWAVGPSFAGILMQSLSPAAPLLAGGALKIIYDIALYTSFRSIRPPEEASKH